MTEAIWIITGVLCVVSLGVGVWLGRKTVTATGAPTDASAAVQVAAAPAEDVAAANATAAAQATAKAQLAASDSDVAARVAELRARGRAGE